jgi:hypothetical protein
MVILWGALCFGLVLGWTAAHLARNGQLGWGEVKAALAVLFGATMPSSFGGLAGLALYTIGLIIGAALYGLTLIVKPLRRSHDSITLPLRR